MRTTTTITALSHTAAKCANGAICQSPATGTCKLIVHVDGFRNQKGNAGISVFTSPDGWPENNDKAFTHAGHPFAGDKATLELRLPPGHYAIAALHDENSNHKLDRNMVGWLKEGFAVSTTRR